MKNDTIAAIATPTGRGGVGIVRLSGPDVIYIGEKIVKKKLKPRYAHYVKFFNTTHQIIDEGLALYFPEPHSFTGESVLELQGHGGPMVMNHLLECVLQYGARLARPGEFSERAFLNNKIDLAQAEAIADLIDAVSIQAAQSAMRTLQGEFSKQVHDLVEALIELRTEIESSLDFAEEVPVLSEAKLVHKLKILFLKVETLLKTAQRGSLMREGFYIAIAGQPNVGKSSLLNRLTGQESAIVTAEPGTTRDLIKEQIQIDGIPIHILDTAGLRETPNIIEQEGIRRTQSTVRRMDLILIVYDNEVFVPDPQLDFLFSLHTKKLLIRNKIDLTGESPQKKTILLNGNSYDQIALSAKQNEGIELLRQTLKAYAHDVPFTENQFMARTRHLEALKNAAFFIQTGETQFKAHRAYELLAADLTEAQKALSQITGEFTSDDLLGKIFSEFCIGK